MPKIIEMQDINVLLHLQKRKKGLRVITLFKGEISVFAGQSGVGKSSLLNVLRPDLEYKNK